jgi:hypothetical protein
LIGAASHKSFRVDRIVKIMFVVTFGVAVLSFLWELLRRTSVVDDDIPLLFEDHKNVNFIFNQKQYPMYLLPVPAAIKLVGMVPHQILLAENKLTMFSTELTGRVIYVSHEWLSSDSPDPSGVQLEYLQSTLRKLQAGKYFVGLSFTQALLRGGNGLQVDHIGTDRWSKALPHMLLWFDYWSIPRNTRFNHEVATIEDVNKAIDSIPYYIEQSSLFMILAPSCVVESRTHSYVTWRRQGWSRMEMICARLSARDMPFLICSGGKPELATNVPQIAPGDGEFPCCECDHLIDGKTIDCDRHRVRKLIEHMIESQDLRDLDDEVEGPKARCYISTGHRFLNGLGDNIPVVEGTDTLEVRSTSDMDRFLEILALRDHTQGQRLLYAAMAGCHLHRSAQNYTSMAATFPKMEFRRANQTSLL